jgi:hypothetical protein
MAFGILRTKKAKNFQRQKFQGQHLGGIIGLSNRNLLDAFTVYNRLHGQNRVTNYTQFDKFVIQRITLSS